MHLDQKYKRYVLPTREIKGYNVMIDETNLFDQPIENYIKAYEDVKKIATGHGDDYTTDSLLDYPNFKENY